jgi:anaerobic ribonucleoside-triphosphate reductase activating protein
MTGLVADMYPMIGPALNIADMDIVRQAAGPGNRLVIWFQGCLKRCPGCANRSFQEKKIKTVLTPAQLARIAENADGIDGITLTGGEPFLQAGCIVRFLSQLRRLPLTTVCYSGYDIEELRDGRSAPEVRELLDAVDLLIDGEYKRKLPPGGAYRSSVNQKLHFLSGRIKPEEFTQDFETIVSISRSSAVSTGALPGSIEKKLVAGLKKAGISFQSDL